MDLVMILTAAVMFSFQFVFTDIYRKEDGSSLTSTLKFTLYTSFFGLIVLLIINKLHLEITAFSLLTACVYSLVFIALSYVSIKALDCANLSVYSVFSMIGGMLLPFIYGLFCNEEFKAIRLICCVLIAFSVAMSVKKGDNSKKAIIYYALVFILNGLVGVISKFHQMHGNICVDSGSFMILTKIIITVFSFILLIFQKERNFTVSLKAILSCGIYSVLNSVGNLLLLIALLSLPASVQYPIITGGVIIISTVIDIIRGENVTKKEISASGIAFVATIFMAI